MREWPTLEGRLKQTFTSELEALEQLASQNTLSKHGAARLKKLRREHEDLKKLTPCIKDVKV